MIAVCHSEGRWGISFAEPGVVQAQKAANEYAQSSPTIMVMKAVSKNEVKVPYVLYDSNNTAERYNRILQYYIYRRVSDYFSGHDL